MKGKRLSKAMAAAGVASRRACEELIFEGRVKVNGVVVRVPQTLVDWQQDKISVDERVLMSEEPKLYFVLNKPAGILCSTVRQGQEQLVLDFFHGISDRLFTVGRLDKESTGLLLVTNDGHFAHRVMHPSFKVTKEYLVKVRQEITHEHLETLSEGARVERRWVRPVSVRKVRRGTFKICVKEGKKHEVRLLAERAGLDIVELMRIRIGGLVLGPLLEGAYRTLTPRERQLVLGTDHP